MELRLGESFGVLWAIPWEDDLYSAILRARGCVQFSDGSLHASQVMERVVRAAEFYKLDEFAFVCGDSPLVDPLVIEHMWECLNGNDFVYNVWPRGHRVLVAKTPAARKYADQITAAAEHAFAGLQEEHDIKLTRFKADKTFIDFSLDTFSDLKFIRSLLREGGDIGKRLEDWVRIGTDIINRYPHFREKFVTEDPSISA
jgi:spore coat polysaccharide biosynthesis protein SpsF (cytidylyltransferase family)